MPDVIPDSDGNVDSRSPAEVALQGYVDAVTRMIGPPPLAPNYQTVLVENDTPAANALADPGTPAPVAPAPFNPMAPDPHAAQLSADYAAALTAYNQRFQYLMDKMMAIDHH